MKPAAPEMARLASPPMTCPARRWAPLVLVLVLALVPALPAHPAAADQISDKRAEAERLAARLDAQAEEASRLAEAYNQARLAQSDAEAEVATAAAAADDAGARLTEHRARVRDQAVVAYMRGGSSSSIEALSRSSAQTVVLQQAYMRTLTSRLREAIDALRVVKADADRARRQADAAAQAARAQALTVATRRAAAAAVEAEQRATLARVTGELQALVEAERRRRAEEEARRARADLAAREAARRRTTTTAPARPSPSPGPSSSPGSGPGSGAPAPNPGAAAAVEEARRQVGKPYEWGGAGPDSFDCSGLVLWAWRAGGRSLPHSAQAQYGVTTHVTLAEIAPGDILFFGSSASTIHHNGIYVGDGQMIEASQTGTPVRYRSIARRDLVGIGRVN